MPGSLLPLAKQIALDNAANPGNGYKFHTYAAGTLTAKETYQDAALTQANTNPVIANARGEVTMYGTGLYRIILKDAADVIIYDRDNVGVLSDFADALRADLAASSGSSLVGHVASGAGAVATTVQAKLREVVSVTDFGAAADSNGTTGNGGDNAAAFQAAIDAVEASGGSYALYVPEGAGVYRLGSPLNIDTAISLIGEGVSPYEGVPGTRGRGSWLYFDHAGRGINIIGASARSGVTLRSFGTMRNQPTPAASWAPNAHDFDIHISNADVLIDGVVLLNPTKGVKLTSGSYGRLYLNRVRMQPFQIGIDVEESYDVVYMDQLHIWPFWKDDTNVHTYTLANLDAIKLGRCDNPMLSNIFTIFANRGLRMYQATAGKTSKLHLVNADFDRGTTGILVDAVEATGQMTNVTIQGETGAAGSRGIAFEGNNNRFEIGNLDVNETAQQAVAMVTGTGHEVRVTNLVAANYNKSGAGFPAVEAATGNTVRVTEVPKISGGGTGAYFGGAGTIRAPLADGTVSATTDELGDVVVTHGAGINPNRVLVQHKANSPLFWSVRDKTSTTFTVRFWTSAGAALTATAIAFDWKAEY